MRFTFTATFAAALSLATAAISGTCSNMPTLPGYGNVYADLSAGDTISGYPASQNVSVTVTYPGGSASCGPYSNGGGSCEGAFLVAPADGRYYFQELSGDGPSPLSCSPAASDDPTAEQEAQTEAANIVSLSELAAVSQAVNQALARTGGVALSNSGLFMSSGGTARQPLGWVSIQGRNYNGNTDGRSYQFSFGGDIDISETARIGLVVSAGKSDLSVGARDVTSESVAYGPYFSVRLGQIYSINGFAVYARPDYEVNGTSYEAERMMASLSANATYQIGGTDIRSSFGLNRSSEKHPNAGPLTARTVTSTTATLSTKAFFNQGSNFRPFASLAGDFSRFDDGLGNEVNHNSARVGTGFVYNTDNASLTVDLSAGQIVEKTNDVALSIGYDFAF